MDCKPSITLHRLYLPNVILHGLNQSLYYMDYYITIIVHTFIIIAITINNNIHYITEICEQKLLAKLAYIFRTRTVFLLTVAICLHVLVNNHHNDFTCSNYQ